MKLSKRELELLKDGLSYAVIYAPSEAETAEFVLLKLKVEKHLAQVCHHCNGTRFMRNEKMEFIKCDHCKNTK